MVVWESRSAMAQTWAALQTYFTENWPEQKQYSAQNDRDSRRQRYLHKRQQQPKRKANTGDAVCNAARLAHKADCANGGGEQIEHGCHDEANECACSGGRSPTGPSAGQGEHPSGKKCHPPWQWQPSQETQAEESPLSQLQLFCNAQARRLLRAQSKQCIGLPRMEVELCSTSNHVTGTGDLTNRSRISSR